MKLDLLLDLASLACPVMARAVYRRVVPRIVLLAVLTITTGVLFSGLLIAGLYGLYQYFGSQQGFAGDYAYALTLGTTALLLLVLVGLILRTLCRLHRALVPSFSKSGGIVEAFLDGLQKPSEPR